MIKLRVKLRVRNRLASLHSRRRGNIVVMASAMMVFVLGLAAFAVDLGYIARTSGQMKSATDGSALAAALELGYGLGPGTSPTQSTVVSYAKTAGTAVANANPAGDKQSVYLNESADFRFGRRTYTNNTWTNNWGVQPYNLVEVTANRGKGAANAGDSPLPLFFGRAMGKNSVDVQVLSRAALLPGTGFHITGNMTVTRAPILPITFDEPSWNALLAGTGSDAYSYNTSTGAVSSGSDSIKEIDLYPYGNQSLVPGNRGTVKIGVDNNSTATLADQIRYGVSKEQLATIGGSIEIPNGSTITLGGNPGLSAGIKDDLTAIIGQPRAIPIFKSVTGPGNNATFTITKFVGIRILFVQLTGGNKRVIAQPAVLTSETVIAGDSSTVSDYIYTKPKLVE